VKRSALWAAAAVVGLTLHLLPGIAMVVLLALILAAIPQHPPGAAALDAKPEAVVRRHDLRGGGDRR